MFVNGNKCISILAGVILLSASLFAADVADYKQRVDSARDGIGTLLDNIASEEAGQEVIDSNEDLFELMRGVIPATEQITTENGTVETANQWYVDGIAAAEKEHALDKRAAILTEINERLAAITVKLDELQNAAAATRSKDEDKRKLSEILNRPEYQKPAEKAESPASDWIRRFFEWLESWFPKFTPPSGAASGIGAIGSVLKYVLIGAIVLLLGFIAYKLLPLVAPRLRRREKKEKSDRVILGERIDDDVSSVDLFSDAERLAREGDLRGAIRKGYIALLCEMSDRKLIGLARHKTNRDYLRDVRSRREIYAQMNGLTGSFERHWYGSQTAQEVDWKDFRDHYRETVSSL